MITRMTRMFMNDEEPRLDESLSDRWCDAAIERARCIVNDIAEDIDNRESRAELRQALAIYADLLWDAHVKLSDKAISETMLRQEDMSGGEPIRVIRVIRVQSFLRASVLMNETKTHRLGRSLLRGLLAVAGIGDLGAALGHHANCGEDSEASEVLAGEA